MSIIKDLIFVLYFACATREGYARRGRYLPLLVSVDFTRPALDRLLQDQTSPLPPFLTTCHDVQRFGQTWTVMYTCAKFC
jgi:hypothetical protein